MAEEADKDVSFTMLRHFLPGFGPFFWGSEPRCWCSKGFSSRKRDAFLLRVVFVKKKVTLK